MERKMRLLKEVRKELHMSQTEAGERLGVTKGTISNYERDGRLLTVEEERSLYGINKRHTRTDINMDIQEVPLYDTEASASVVEIFSADNTMTPVDYIRIPNLPKCDGAMPIRGDSMYPLLKSGDIILYKILNDKQNIIWGEMYIVYINNNGDEFLLTKFLKPSEREGYVRFISQNSHHEPIEFPIDSIQSIAHIKASIRINTKI